MRTHHGEDKNANKLEGSNSCEKSFPCEECGKNFKNNAAMKKHMVSQHEATSMSIGGKKKTKIKKANKIDVEYKHFSCKDCQISYSSKEELEEHKMSIGHWVKDSQECDLSVNNIQVVPHDFLQEFASEKIHEIGHEVKIEIRNDEVEYEIEPMKETRNDISIDMSNAHICDVCKKVFSSLSVLKAHKKLHIGEGFSCDLCDKQFARRYDMNRHRKIHSKDKRLSCGKCRKTFTTQLEMSEHLSTHLNDEKKFSCQFCGVAYAEQNNLMRHKKLHSEDKPFVCVNCGIDFLNYENLTSHMRFQHTEDEERPFSCRFCGSAFSDKFGLARHERIHTGEKPYSCNICGKTFNDHGNRNKHLKIHADLLQDEKKLSCDICEEAFARTADLNNHMKTHASDKPYSCELCQKSYFSNKALTEHNNSSGHLLNVEININNAETYH